MGKYEYINYQNKLYYVYRRVKTHHIKMDYVQDFRDFWLCDIVLKHNHQNEETFVFLREIPDLEVLR